MDNQHFYAVGRSGFGKSTLLKNRIFGDLDLPIFVIDPHGEDARDLISRLPASYYERLCYFDLSASTTPTFNPILEPWHAILPFQVIWKDSYGPRLNYQLYHALAAVFEAKLTLQEVPRLFHDKPFRLKTLERVTSTATRTFWLKEYPSWPDRIQHEAAVALYNKVGILLASPIASAITPRPHHATYDFTRALKTNTITVVNLAKGSIGDEAASLFASLFTTTFRHTLMTQPTRCLFIADEFQNYGTEIYVSMLSELRKFGLQLGLAHQFATQIEPTLLHAILGNVRDTYLFNVQHADAKLLAAPYQTIMTDITDELANLPPFTAYLNGARTELPPFGPSLKDFDAALAASRSRFNRRTRSPGDKVR
jgi:hypothetical protein